MKFLRKNIIWAVIFIIFGFAGPNTGIGISIALGIAFGLALSLREDEIKGFSETDLKDAMEVAFISGQKIAFGRVIKEINDAKRNSSDADASNRVPERSIGNSGDNEPSQT